MALEQDLKAALKLKDPAYRARHIRRELVPQAKRLSAEVAAAQAQAVREWYETGIPMGQIAFDLGVSKPAVQQMIAVAGGTSMPPSVNRLTSEERLANVAKGEDDNWKHAGRK